MFHFCTQFSLTQFWLLKCIMHNYQPPHMHMHTTERDLISKESKAITVNKQIIKIINSNWECKQSAHLWNALIRLVGFRSNGPSGKDRSPCLIDLRYSRVTRAWPETNEKILCDKHCALRITLKYYKKKLNRNKIISCTGCPEENNSEVNFTIML